MSRKSGQAEAALVTLLGLVALVFIALGLLGCPKYNVYKQRLDGESLLAHAQASK